MKVLTKTNELQQITNQLKLENRAIGFVPTMGALHQGHISLVEKSTLENKVTIVSIFVNPTQFDKVEDLEKYPKTIESDIALLEKTNCDYLFLPSASNIYNKQIEAKKFSFDGLENEMEGKFRDNHFDGVGTIVKKLFEIAQPTKSYFGEKDFQQLQIIRKLTEKEQLGIEIIGCSIYREQDGLAMSSRNSRLTAVQKKEAPFIYKTLKKVVEKYKKEDLETISSWVASEFAKNKVLELEYFEIADERTLKSIDKKSNNKTRAFIAVFADSIRLIDNISLQ
jgi:pantoate--beta-alanine ligase